MAMTSSNPVFGRSPALQTPSPQELQEMYDAPERLTMDHVVNRTAMLLAVLIAAGAVAWIADVGLGVMLIAAITGFVLGLVNCFKKQVSPALVLAYAAAEGVFLGAISHVMDDRYPGIAVQAAMGTALLFGGMLFAYKSGRIRVTPRFTKIVVGATIGMIGLALVNLLINAFDGPTGDGWGLRSGGTTAIVFSLGMIALASLFLALDFDMADKMVEAGVPERESWRIAFGLVVTLVWLYLEVLRLLSYFRD